MGERETLGESNVNPRRETFIGARGIEKGNRKTGGLIKEFDQIQSRDFQEQIARSVEEFKRIAHASPQEAIEEARRLIKAYQDLEARMSDAKAQAVTSGGQHVTESGAMVDLLSETGNSLQAYIDERYGHLEAGLDQPLPRSHSDRSQTHYTKRFRAKGGESMRHLDEAA